MRILFISTVLPYPPISGGLVRTYNLMRHIARNNEIWLAACQPELDRSADIAHLQEFCCGVETGHVQPYHALAHLPGLLRYALAGIPLELKFKYSRELVSRIRQLTSQVKFDIIQIEGSNMSHYVDVLPRGSGRVDKRILMFHDIQFRQWRRIAQFEQRPIKKLRAFIHSVMMRRWEPLVAERFDRCGTVSAEERTLLLSANRRLCIDIVPNGVDTQDYQPLPANNAPNLLFIGTMGYLPCADAALYFCKEILPIIKSSNIATEMWIVGKDPLPEVAQLDGNGIHVTGRVDSVLPYYAKSSVCVVPLRAGGGTRLKILEAMALGRPVVSTTIGCEGLGVADEEHLLIADTPDQFADQILRLLNDQTLYQRITTNARQMVVDRYDWSAIARQLTGIYSELTGTGETLP